MKCGIIANLILAITYLFRPINKHLKYNLQTKEIEIPEKNKERLKSILGIETDYGLQSAYKRAFKEFNRFQKFWLYTWIGWVVLYSYWLVSDILLPQGSPIKSSDYFIALQPVTSNISSLFILFAFLVLYFKREDMNNNNFWKLFFITLFLVSILIVLNGKDVHSLTSFYDVLSGLLAGLSIALLTGRLDSKFLAIPFSIIVLLYTYALIQSSIKDFDSNTLEESKIVYKAINLNIALVAKSMLMILFAWLTSTNRLIYYLIVANKKEGEVEANMDSIAKYL